MNTIIYKNMRSTEGVKTTLSVILEAIKNGRWKDQVEEYRRTKDSLLKENFPCFTLSGMFLPTKSVANLKEQSGYLSLDIDDFEGDGEELIDLVDDVLGTSLFSMFKSGSGNGYCALVKICTFTDEKHFKRLYHAIYTALEPSLSKISKFDYLPNVNRLRYISFDSNLYLNTFVEDWTDELEPPTQVELPLPKSEKKLTLVVGSQLTEQEKYDLVVSKYVSVTGHFGSNGGTRHDWILGLARWLCRGGISESFAIIQILIDYQNSSRADVWNQEVRRCVRDSYRAYSVESGSYEPTKKFSYDDILRCSNIEEIREQVLLLIADKINYKEYLVENKKLTTFIEKEIKFYNKLINFI